ncbi:tyrosine-protein phosphatase [Scandinavium lactucae]|uniref:Tyrosine-protein phosphatase n=1 Tax=Scandinavium lactucae TaxID=3095028 RepID=A0ABU4QUG3_9ENTR|nr:MULTISPECIES: tyrosine-protein phosphatase [unclassified Scandinavium]MDX6042935.1 tyrosine-protein phosphatase [Scandinavium sp. V105_6]MDX6052936.1 tyrosine-protein phosphatase [Scandinavium sp. V105_1]
MKSSVQPLALLISLVCCVAQADDLSLSTPRLAGIDNFRDVAGLTSAYRTDHDGVMRAGVFYRSNALTPQGDDLAVLNTLKVTTVIDLRSPTEVASQQDSLPANSRYVNVDLIGSNGAFVIDLSKMTVGDVDTMMESGERSFVTSDYTRQGLGEVFRELASADEATLFHCTAGKDRTGWVSAVLQTIAGVSQDDIMANYLATNAYTAPRINATLSTLPASMRDTYGALMGVRANWLQAGLDQVVASYGSMDNYLKQGLGLDQATLYVLRGKMVRYLSLPGQTAFSGNAAEGAGLLNALQDSALSGRYTAYNYYLQNAIDTGSLAGVEKQVGGQVHADAASYLLRQPSRLYDALAPVISGQGMQNEQSRVWLQGLSSYLGTDSSAQASASSEHTNGAMVGVTYRVNDRGAINGGLAYSHGAVSSAGGEVKTNTTALSLGGRYALETLDSGPWLGLQGSAGYIDYQSERHLNGVLGTASGDSNGQYFSGRASVGWLTNAATLSLTPALGVQVSHLNIDGFQESGSELALDMAGVNETQTSLTADLGINIQPQTAGNWTLMPGITLGYERVLNDDTTASHGTLYGFGVDQTSAFGSNNLYKAGLQLSASYRNVTVGTRVNYLTADTHSDGVSGQLDVAIAF